MKEGSHILIPNYNYQFLFRKKSHLRFAKDKKNNSQKTKNNLQNNNFREKDVKKGHWTSEQNKLYHWFLEIHSKHFIEKNLRRSDKIFKRMTTFIRTREAEQCRSHHQKTQKKYHSFREIIIKLRTEHYHSLSVDLVRSDL